MSTLFFYFFIKEVKKYFVPLMYMSITELDKRGYVIIKNPLTQQQLNNGLSSVKVVGNKSQIDYTILTNFIDNDFIPKINEKLNWKAIYMKYRFSNHQNAKDASTFHGDVYNFVDDNIMEIYTGLIYFDEAVLEVIPGSHLKNDLSSNCQFNNKISLKISAGDMLVFHANLHHRGVFYESTNKNRRILQVFDIFPNEELYNKNQPKLLSVITGNSGLIDSFTSLSEVISKIKFINDIINYVSYMLMNNNIQYSIVFSDISSDKKTGRYVGYVPGKIDVVKKNTLQDWNINIITRDQESVEPDRTGQKIILILILMYIIIKLKQKNVVNNIT